MRSRRLPRAGLEMPKALSRSGIYCSSSSTGWCFLDSGTSGKWEHTDNRSGHEWKSQSWYEAHQQCRNKIIDFPVMCVTSRCNNKDYINVDLLFVHREGPCTKHLRHECWQRKPGAVSRDSIRNCTTEQNSFGCEVSRQVLHDNPRQARPN